MNEQRMHKYRVYLHSKPGMWATYDGYVDVWAEDWEDAEARAKQQLKRGTFPDRNESDWLVGSVEMMKA